MSLSTTADEAKRKDFADADDPIKLFDEWFTEAKLSEPNDHNAMALATVDESGMPSVRMVLLKAQDERGFVFYTNFESRKGRELLANRKAALLFHWKSLRRQIRVCGNVEVVSDAEANAYFASRPRGAQIGAWASQQSRPIGSRAELEERQRQFEAQFGDGAVPRPPHWSGFRVVPIDIEFWRDGQFRLHDRIVFTRRDSSSSTTEWSKQRLMP